MGSKAVSCGDKAWSQCGEARGRGLSLATSSLGSCFLFGLLISKSYFVSVYVLVFWSKRPRFDLLFLMLCFYWALLKVLKRGKL